jgi:hypothetical protein
MRLVVNTVDSALRDFPTSFVTRCPYLRPFSGHWNHRLADYVDMQDTLRMFCEQQRRTHPQS